MSKVRRARRAHKAATQQDRVKRAIERARAAQERAALQELHAYAEGVGNKAGDAFKLAIERKLGVA